MKYLLLLIISSLTFYGISNHSSSTKNDYLLDRIEETECSRFYEFGDTVYDLFSLKPVNFKKEDIQLFKECSYYKNRFEGDRFGFHLTKDSVLKDRYCTYTFTNPSTVKVKDPDYEVNYYDLPHEMFDDGKEIQPYTLSHPSGIILIYEFPDSLFYHIYKMKYNGEIIGHLRVKHTSKDKTSGSEIHYSRYLYPYDYREDYLVFSGSGHWNEYEKTVVVNLNEMTLKEHDFDLSAVIWDDFDREIRGYLLMPEGNEYGEKTTIKMFWKRDSSYTELEIPYASETCKTILWGNQLIVANYNSISTGSSLQCFDTYTKKKLWKADVLQMMVDHSKYYNKVTLSKYHNFILMEGNEAYGNYLQIFEMNTGKRIAELGDVVTKK